MALAFCHALRYQAGMANETIETLARRLAESLPQGLKNVGEEIEQNFRAVLTSGLSKLDLVSREEFDVQQAVLARTREKLEALQKRLDVLENPPRAATGGKATKKKAAKKKSAAHSSPGTGGRTSG